MINRYQLVTFIFIAVSILLSNGFLPNARGSHVSSKSPNETKSPNIVLIISDDQAWTDYGFMGHPQIKTPNLDRLARQSVLFRRGYVPTALCRPSLMSIISGRYAHDHGVTGNDPAKPQSGPLRTSLISKSIPSKPFPRSLGNLGTSVCKLESGGKEVMPVADSHMA